MLPSLLADTYHRYKQDTDDIATWLATTARRFGFSSDILTGNSKISAQQKSKRLKGKARKEGKQTSSTDTSLKPSTFAPKYTIAVKDFITLAEFLAPKLDVKVPTPVWETIERAISLRQGHNDYHAQQQTATNGIDDGHAYFLGVLEKVRDVLKSRRQTGPTPPQGQTTPSSDPTEDVEVRLDNMFAALTVEEPSEGFLNAPDIAPATKSDKATAMYIVEPSDDPLELYLATAAMLQDCSRIRNAIRHAWRSYSQRAVTLTAAAITTDVGIKIIQELEEQFMTDHPSESSTVNARGKFFAVQCVLQGQDPSARLRHDDPINFTLYELAETSLVSTHSLVDAFRRVLKVNDLPLYKPGFYGVFDPAKDRASMTGGEKSDEDKVLLLELLSDIVFFHQANKAGQLKATDEFTKAVALLKSQDRHTMALDFAAQIHLDIQQCLRGQSAMGAVDLKIYVMACKGSLNQNFEFHANLRVENWPRENDQPLRMISEVMERWLLKDTYGELKAKNLTALGIPLDQLPPSYAFFKAHPWLCGSLMFGIKLDMQEMGLALLNAWGSAKFTAQIYNAIRQEKFLTKSWQDMDLAIMIHGEPAMFVGDRPKNMDDYFQRFALSMGYSAQNFAQGGKRKHSRPIVSNKGPRGELKLKDAIPVAYELRFGYSNFESKTVSDPEKVLAKVLEIDYELHPEVVDGHKRHGKRHTTPEALTMICQSLASEDLALTFDHFRLHRQAWRLLRAIKDNVADDLRRIYGPGYLETENQLPFVVGYIFMTAVKTKKLGALLLPKKEDIVSSKLLMKASEALEGMIDSGAGGLEIKILREKYGMEIEVEVEDANGVTITTAMAGMAST
ncbi:uncharacterized protein CC84DRAFT_1206013 [Paraphaeosphaeria sporulosa]|uniref:DUF6604 domain-containing protein n=1 Tax=Paraphaeosphaeria sporulosa TaxID=1460663 RepID=A0A177CAT6_9PLEO|nr:uncharacterized protein CC84DRAFT_1206013 [Paraphaeosphaeria sporulosa]OAG04281.1 hypothetical protein CC84DRAFT_1206013 [Paraphaeosphaeria sporulosa]